MEKKSAEIYQKNCYIVQIISRFHVLYLLLSVFLRCCGLEVDLLCHTLMYLQLHRRPLTHLNVAQVAVYARHRCQQQGEQFHFLSLHLAVLLKQYPQARVISQVN